jgi:succinate dehydrogenase/fumarate reductase iron-sulfur protein
MKVSLVRDDGCSREELEFEFQSLNPESRERPMVLDVLLQAETTEMPDLAYRYGCRNGLCGVCTVDVNGTARLACRTKVRAGDRISAMSGLPVLRDLVVRRDSVNRQLIGYVPAQGEQQETGADNEAYIGLNRCIECYACLSGCPLHEKNDTSAVTYEHGNPYAFLKLQRVIEDEGTSDFASDKAGRRAVELGLATCLECKGCSCGVGIDLMKDVIRPLLAGNDYKVSESA